jgi:hypothetical protein
MSLVVLARYLSLNEAHAAAGALRAAGLNPTVMDEGYGSVEPFQQVMLQGFRLAVPQAEAAVASDVLSTATADADHDDEMFRDDEVEPQPTTRRWGLGWTLLAILLFVPGFWPGFALVMARRKPTPVRIVTAAVLGSFSLMFWGVLLTSWMTHLGRPSNDYAP